MKKLPGMNKIIVAKIPTSQRNVKATKLPLKIITFKYYSNNLNTTHFTTSQAQAVIYMFTHDIISSNIFNNTILKNSSGVFI